MYEKNKNLKYANGYEVRALKGWDKSKADYLKDDKMVASAYKYASSCETTTELEDGTSVNVPILVDIAINQLKYWKDHPEKADPKMLASIFGEMKQEVVVETETASSMFVGIVAGAKNNGSDSGEK